MKISHILKYGSEEKGSSLCRCSSLLGFIMSKKQERLHSELLSEDRITNLLGLGFLNKTQGKRESTVNEINAYPRKSTIFITFFKIDLLFFSP